MRSGRNRKQKRSRSGSGGTTAPARTISKWPVSRNPVLPIARSLRRKFAADAVNIDGIGAQTMQFTFAPGATDIRLAGTSIYVDSVPNVSEFTSLFDQWRIKSVVFRLDFPANYASSGANASPIVYPMLYYVLDYDDYTNASINDMLQYPQVQMHNFAKDGYTPMMIKFSPKPLRDIAGSGISTGYGPMPTAPWIRTSDFTIPHYGLKIAFDWFGYAVANYMNFIVTIQYELEFTNPKWFFSPLLSGEILGKNYPFLCGGAFNQLLVV